MIEKFANNEKLKKRRGRGCARVRRRVFKRGYNQLRLCDKQVFVRSLMAVLGMDRAGAVRVIRWGLAATHQKRGCAEHVEKLFESFKIYNIWDD
ncbi:MAG: hypothetical protein PUF10_02660 [Bacteroidales bacterium]|nr:hypothetical protein [Bacteroidales bacterium]